MTASPEDTTEESGWTGFFSSWLAVGGIWALAIARPMYVAIASGPEALTGLGIRRLDLIVLIAVLSFVAPTSIALAGLALGKLFGPKVRSAFISITAAVLIGIFCWQQVDTMGPLLRALLPLAAIAVSAFLLFRSKFIQNFAVILGIAIPVVIVSFLVSYPIWAEAGPHEETAGVAKIETDTPVVMVIFDELPLATLEDKSGRIDRKLFPNFAELAEKSSWYPQMLAAGTATTQAVPAVLDGRRPEDGITTEPTPPGLPDYPNNVCTVAEGGGYELHTYEPVTDLCKRSFGMGSRVTEAIRRGAGATGDFSSVKVVPGDLGAKVANKLAAPFKRLYGELDSTRAAAVDEFIDGLPADSRTFSLLHIALPHIYWEFMPDGSRYSSNRFTGVESLTSPASKAQVDSDFQQYMLQLQFTDHELGRIIRKMKEQGIWDESLFVVTADHGAGFIPGGSRRILENANAGWVLPVPLFIKYPGQETGKVVAGGANTIDVAPTVSDVLGVDPPAGSQGVSLFGRASLPLSREITAHGAFGTVTMKRSMVTSQFGKARTQTAETFPDGELFALAGHAGLLGESPADVKGLEPVEATIDQAAELAAVNPSSGEIPSYVKAVTPALPAGTPVAVALNGKVVATTATWDETASGRVVTAVNLPSGDFVEGANTVALYAITGNRKQ